MPVEIRSEDDFIAAVEDALENDSRLGEGIQFIDWPRYEITIRGEDFDGGVPTRIMPALFEIQRTLNRAYARNVYGDERKRLSRKEQKQTELIIRLEPGSTTFTSDLGPALNSMVSNMSGTESMLTILGVAGIVTVGLGFKAYLTHRASIKRADVPIQLSEEETKRMTLMTRVLQQNMNASSHQQDMEDAQGKLMRGLDDNDVLVLDEDASIRGYDARRLAREPRRARVHGRIDGEFLIQAVASGQVRHGIRARLRDVSTDQILTVNIPEGTLPEEQVDQLKVGEWSKTPLVMTINVQRIGERIVRADLVEAGLRPQ